MPTVAKDQTIPRYYVQCVVGDRLPGDDHLHNPWHVFLVELMHGKISILVNHTWMPLETWRQFPTSSRP